MSELIPIKELVGVKVKHSVLGPDYVAITVETHFGSYTVEGKAFRSEPSEAENK